LEPFKSFGKNYEGRKTDFSQIFRNQHEKSHKSVRPNFAKTTQQTIENLGWEVLSRPAYSSDLALSEYYLFRSVQNFLSEKTYQETERVKKEVAQYFASLQVSFFEKGIRSVPER
jgi:histone-lysine N-methyltransferase SETMAR